MRIRRPLRTLAASIGLPLALSCAASALRAQAPLTTHPAKRELPFAPGEKLQYQVRISRVGDVGTGRMWIEGPVLENGIQTWRLRSEIEAGKGPIRATDRTSSWIDPQRLATVRFTKQERHLLSSSDEDVTVDLAAKRWRDALGPSGVLANDSALDELSFLYLLRTLPLDRDTVIRLDRHFDAGRNPTVIRTVGRDTLTTPAGIFRTRIIEMEVRDPKRYKGTGIVRIHLYDGDCRIPIRIESRMPVLGVTTLTLSGWTHSGRYPDALPCG